jgi:hypothetical protein
MLRSEAFTAAKVDRIFLRYRQLPYVYDYIIKLCRKGAEVIRTHENEHVRGVEQGEARHGKYTRFKLGGGQAYDRSSD